MKRLNGRTSHCTKCFAYVDDVVLFATLEEALQRMVSIFDGICTAFGQQVSADKSKVLVVHPPLATTRAAAPIITVGTTTLEVVSKFTYLGSTEDEGADMDEEISERVAKMSRAYYMDKARIYKRNSIPKKARLQFFLAKVATTATYGCQVWNFRAEHLNRLNMAYKLLLKDVTGLKHYTTSWEDLIAFGHRHGCCIVPLDLRMEQLQLTQEVYRACNQNDFHTHSKTYLSLQAP
jgi:hypothetical protein